MPWEAIPPGPDGVGGGPGSPAAESRVRAQEAAALVYVARLGLRKRLVHPSLEGPRRALTAQPPSLGLRGDTTSPGTRPPVPGPQQGTESSQQALWAQLPACGQLPVGGNCPQEGPRVTPAASTCGTHHRGLGPRSCQTGRLTLLTAKEGAGPRPSSPLPPSSSGPSGITGDTCLARIRAKIGICSRFKIESLT